MSTAEHPANPQCGIMVDPLGISKRRVHSDPDILNYQTTNTHRSGLCSARTGQIKDDPTPGQLQM